MKLLAMPLKEYRCEVKRGDRLELASKRMTTAEACCNAVAAKPQEALPSVADGEHA